MRILAIKTAIVVIAALKVNYNKNKNNNNTMTTQTFHILFLVIYVKRRHEAGNYEVFNIR